MLIVNCVNENETTCSHWLLSSILYLVAGLYYMKRLIVKFCTLPAPPPPITTKSPNKVEFNRTEWPLKIVWVHSQIIFHQWEIVNLQVMCGERFLVNGHCVWFNAKNRTRRSARITRWSPLGTDMPSTSSLDDYDRVKRLEIYTLLIRSSWTVSR